MDSAIKIPHSVFDRDSILNSTKYYIWDAVRDTVWDSIRRSIDDSGHDTNLVWIAVSIPAVGSVLHSVRSYIEKYEF